MEFEKWKSQISSYIVEAQEKDGEMRKNSSANALSKMPEGARTEEPRVCRQSRHIGQPRPERERG